MKYFAVTVTLLLSLLLVGFAVSAAGPPGTAGETTEQMIMNISERSPGSVTLAYILAATTTPGTTSDGLGIGTYITASRMLTSAFNYDENEVRPLWKCPLRASA